MRSEKISLMSSSAWVFAGTYVGVGGDVDLWILVAAACEDTNQRVYRNGLIDKCSARVVIHVCFVMRVVHPTFTYIGS